MIKKILTRFLGLLALLMMTAPLVQALNFDAGTLRAVIEGNEMVPVNKKIILNASGSFAPDKEKPVKYLWDFGDGSPVLSQEEVVHTYKNHGAFEIALTISQDNQEDTVRRTLFVYEKLVPFLTDAAEEQDMIRKLTEEGRSRGILVPLIESFESTTAFVSEETLVKKLADQVETLVNAPYIVSWTRRGSGINALTRLLRERPEISETMKEKTLVVLTNDNLTTLGRIMQSNYDIIQPRQIILTRPNELRNVIAADSMETFLSDLQKSSADHRIINAESGRVKLWNAISYLVNFMIANGIPSNTIVLLLMLPVIVTIITFIKQVIGITTFGLYMPSIIALSFLALGLKFGLLILIITVASGTVLRKALDRFRLLNTPRVAIILTLSTLIILLMLAFGTYLNISQLATIAVFPMLIMTTLSEKFTNAISEKGFYGAMILTVETLLIALMCYWVVEWQYMQNLILSYPEIILLLLLINLILGRWTGLRMLEYIRFREVMKHAEEE